MFVTPNIYNAWYGQLVTVGQAGAVDYSHSEAQTGVNYPRVHFRGIEIVPMYEWDTSFTALAGAIAQSAGVNVNNIGTVVNAFKNGNYMTGINDIAGRLGVETSPGITLAASLIDQKDYVSGFAAAASALGAYRLTTKK